MTKASKNKKVMAVVVTYNRKELLKVSRLNDKVYQQAAGFLRVKEGNNPLDGF